MENLISGLDSYKATLITGRNAYEEPLTINPEIRATVFPLDHLVYIPIRFFFSFIEGLLLIAMYTIHRIFNFAAGVAWFLFQMWMYSIAEQLISGAFKTLDQIIVELLPGWIPTILVNGTTTMLGVAGLKCYWYSISFWECLKWMVICRLGLYVFIQISLALVTLVDA